MLCQVLSVKEVKTRFGDRLLLEVSHPEYGKVEVWSNPAAIKAGDSIDVQGVPGKFKVKTNKDAKDTNGDDEIKRLVHIFSRLREELPEETSEAIAKLAITLYLKR